VNYRSIYAGCRFKPAQYAYWLDKRAPATDIYERGAGFQLSRPAFAKRWTCVLLTSQSH